MIDLKRVEIKHGDIGQMNLYLNYFENAICQPDDNSPVGIVLGTKKDKLLMEYALQGIDNQLFAIRYQQRLPNREELQAQLNLLLDNTKLLQKSEMRKEIVIELSYKGFSRASDYSWSHRNHR